ncbi:MAG: S-adenosylmethionine decarboxylase [Alphaproteobacteria bacterium]|nr:S-adenosylmethionine decarboxylase [Alphaproteobacteria bacterium]
MNPFTLQPVTTIPPFSVIQKLFRERAFWGMATALDLKECGKDFINSKEVITQYSIELCDMIKMKRYGDPQVVYFGEEERVEGYTLVQMIETSLISGHFTPYSKSAYIDIFSCALYNPHDVAVFTKDFFKASSLKLNVAFRE